MLPTECFVLIFGSLGVMIASCGCQYIIICQYRIQKEKIKNGVDASKAYKFMCESTWLIWIEIDKVIPMCWPIVFMLSSMPYQSIEPMTRWFSLITMISLYSSDNALIV